MFKIRLTSQNLDWGLHNPEWRKIVLALMDKSDVIVFQEAKWCDLHQFEDKTWAVFQDRSNDATAGTAVMWRKSLGYKRTTRLRPFTPHHNGVKMPTRYIAEVDLSVVEWGRVVTFGSFHYPPVRFRFLWPVSDNNLNGEVHRLRKRLVPFAFGSDFNEKVVKQEVHGIAKRLGLWVRGIRIDGFVVAKRLKTSSIIDLGNNLSDHNPVQIHIWPEHGKGS